jgi:hypothetical protein
MTKTNRRTFVKASGLACIFPTTIAPPANNNWLPIKGDPFKCFNKLISQNPNMDWVKITAMKNGNKIYEVQSLASYYQDRRWDIIMRQVEWAHEEAGNINDVDLYMSLHKTYHDGIIGKKHDIVLNNRLHDVQLLETTYLGPPTYDKT